MSESPTKEIEIFLMINEDGDYEVATDNDLVLECFEENVGGTGQVTKITLTVTLPKPREVSGVLPEGSENVNLTLTES